MKRFIDPLLRALTAADEAGRAILEVYQKHIEVQYKDDRSPLTLADRRSHEIISRRLSDNVDHPLPMLSEEGKDIPFIQRKQWTYFWMVDPLDGTKEFIKRNHEFTVNIALIDHDRPVLGVVYVPVHRLFYFAAQGIGAFRLDGQEDFLTIAEKEPAVQKEACLDSILKRSVRLPVSDPPSEICGSRLVIVGSRSHPSKELEEFVARMRTEYKEVEFISAGSALKLCLVAEGRADIYPRLGPTMEWDTAAGQAVVEQAGGRVVDADTKSPLKYNKENLLNPWFIVTVKDIPAMY